MLLASKFCEQAYLVDEIATNETGKLTLDL